LEPPTPPTPPSPITVDFSWSVLPEIPKGHGLVHADSQNNYQIVNNDISLQQRTLQFYDDSIGIIVSRQWLIGSEVVSTDPSPTFTDLSAHHPFFYSGGKFWLPVTLVVNGGVSSKTQNIQSDLDLPD
jgi:hypothetical protein